MASPTAVLKQKALQALEKIPALEHHPIGIQCARDSLSSWLLSIFLERNLEPMWEFGHYEDDSRKVTAVSVFIPCIGWEFMIYYNTPLSIREQVDAIE